MSILLLLKQQMYKCIIFSLHILHKWHNHYYDYVEQFINSHIQEESSFQTIMV